MDNAKLWTHFQVVDNYQNQLNSLDWKELLLAKRFDFRKDKDLHESVRMSVQTGLNDISKEARKAAWLLMLGIDTDG